MIPIYIFYSMFGFQRTGDGLWAAADQMARGFLLGATAGRTTLTGEGLQHADGHSLLLASIIRAASPTIPRSPSRSPTSSRTRCAGCTTSPEHPDGENIFYYLTVYNEPYLQPAEPCRPRASRGHPARHLPYTTAAERRRRAQGADPGLRGGDARRRCGRPSMLADDWGVAADVWSVDLLDRVAPRRRSACESQNMLHPDRPAGCPT